MFCYTLTVEFMLWGSAILETWLKCRDPTYINGNIFERQRLCKSLCQTYSLAPATSRLSLRTMPRYKLIGTGETTFAVNELLLRCISLLSRVMCTIDDPSPFAPSFAKVWARLEFQTNAVETMGEHPVFRSPGTYLSQDKREKQACRRMGVSYGRDVRKLRKPDTSF